MKEFYEMVPPAGTIAGPDLPQCVNHATATAQEAPALPGGFRRKIKRERGNKCELCGIAEPTKQARKQLTEQERSKTALHLHHIQKQRDQPHLRFKRHNIVVCCQECHLKLENGTVQPPRKRHVYTSKFLFPLAAEMVAKK